MITIQSARDGFRRCGIAHPAAPVSYPADRFSKEELAVLVAEPMLTVSFDDAQPASNPNRAELLAAACGQLDADKENRKHWTVSGAPQIKALEEISGLTDVTAAERDAAFATVKGADGQ